MKVEVRGEFRTCQISKMESFAKIDLPSISKFSYLKEMLEPKVQLLVDGLPLNTEGYTRAKNLLTSRYGKLGEVVNTHIQTIMTLPIVYGSNTIRIHEFYEKRLAHVQ